MTTHTLTGNVTDTMGATDTDTATIASTASAPQRVVRRSFFENRLNWGGAVIGVATTLGPTFSDDTFEGSMDGYACPPSPVTLSIIFKVLRSVKITGCRIYKAPNATATSVPVKLWSGVASGTELASTTIGPWVADNGGWRQVTFSSPVTLVPDVTYVLGYYAEGGIYSYSPWVWHAQPTCVWPLVNEHLHQEVSNTDGSAYMTNVTGTPITTITFPTVHYAANYYIDPQIEWDAPEPGYVGGLDYFDQWVQPHADTANKFPVAVFFCDPPFVEAYYDLGFNTLIGGSPVGTADFPDNGVAYMEAMNAFGNAMDWYPSFTGAEGDEILRTLDDYPDIAGQVRGYVIIDEPDMSAPYLSPTELRLRANYIKARDSTRPLYLTFGLWAVYNQGFAWSPQGASPQFVNEAWRAWSDCTDIVSCDAYALTDDRDPEGRLGVWAYAAQVGRMREVTDGTKPIWATIETTSQTPAQPVPTDVAKATWAALIAGARGIVYFDHRFPTDFVNQDFNAIHADPAMQAVIVPLAAQMQTLADALHSPDLGLVTAWTTSNKTAGPIGGEFGVRVHYTTRADASHHYLFAQTIRPGATTATFTIPAWAGVTLTVIGESRTVTVSGGGVLTDTFAADYSYHLYQKTP